MAETFGKTDKGSGSTICTGSYQFACKHQSGSAGVLDSISLYVKEKTANGKVKCAIYDSGFNLLENGTTEEKEIPAGQDNWMTFNFATSPSVAALTDYWLAWWFDKDQTIYREVETDRTCYDVKVYNTWDDPLVPDGYNPLIVSIYATYYEAPPAAKLVQATLISIPPLIVLPTLREILRVTGG